jgi:hypothetical protein
LAYFRASKRDDPSLPTGDGAPYALTSTAATTDEVWFSTYDSTANATLYIGNFNAAGTLTLYALPSSVATGGDLIDGLIYTTLDNFTSGAIAFSVYGTNHKTGNFLNLACGGTCYQITTALVHRRPSGINRCGRVFVAACQKPSKSS